MRLLRESTEELRKEVIQKRLEIKILREDLASKQKQLTKEQKELEEVLEYQVGLKVRCGQSVGVQTSRGHMWETSINRNTAYQGKDGDRNTVSVWACVGDQRQQKYRLPG